MRQHSTFQVILLFFIVYFCEIKFFCFEIHFVLCCKQGFVLSASLHLTLVWLILLFALFKAFF